MRGSMMSEDKKLYSKEENNHNKGDFDEPERD